MKKLFSFLLALTLLTGLTAPALAGDDADERLAAVTAQVKQTLQLNTDAYDSYSGNLYEDGLSPVWNLSWTGKAGSLTIQAGEDGSILSYSYYDKSDSTYINGRFRPSFPQGSETEARAAAQAFLDKVLDASTESVALEEDSQRSLGSSQFYYSGTISLNGLPSPLSYSITVRATDNVILSFSRDSLENRYLGGVPSATPAAGADAAGALLKSTLALRLEYVLSDDGKTAVLRYLPQSGDQYFVDAQTGTLVDLTELYNTVAENGFYGLGDKEASAADRSGSFTDAEQAGVERMEGVLSKETLDGKLRGITELGLGRYTLSSASYWVNSSTGDVTCRLQYVRQAGEDLWRRYVTVDAKTGDLQSVYSSIPWSEDEKPDAAVTAAQAQKAAEAFLASYYGEDYARLALYDNGGPVTFSEDSASYAFRYAQKENGYFYAGNYYQISIDATDGSVSSFDYSFNRDVTFDSPDGLISADAALSAYFDTFRVQLGYQAVPEQLDPNSPEYAPLVKMGYTYLYSLRLAYTLEQKAENCCLLGIDAKTGRPVLTTADQSEELTYDDLSGHWVKEAAEKLAQYRVGYLGGSFQPAKELTQFDLLCLLVSTRGYLYDPADPSEAAVDQVYDLAYGMGLIKPAQRADTQIVTRGELVKLILNAGGYGEVAQLPGIFRCAYRDESSIPAEYYGYAALAQGLGIASGDGGGNFACTRTATRAEAAAMLCKLMSR